MLHKLAQSDPSGSIHVQMALVRYVLLIYSVRQNALCTKPNGWISFILHQKKTRKDVPSRENTDELGLELHRERGNVGRRILSNHQHLPQMPLGLRMAFEPVLVSALLLAHLTVPPQALQALGLHLVGQVLWRTNCIRRVNQAESQARNGQADRPSARGMMS